jgi:large subunit ribosomal protein L29
MKAEDLKTKTADELTKLLLDARKEQMNLRFQRSGGQLEKTAPIRAVRRRIARIKTFMNVGKAAAAPKAAKPAKAAPAKKAAAKKSGEKAA